MYSTPTSEIEDPPESAVPLETARLATGATERTSATTQATCDSRRCGRMFGGLVLAAFVLYGVGSSLAGNPIGVAIVSLNSIAVALMGAIGFRLLRSTARRVGTVYAATRLVEATALFIGVAAVAAGAPSGAGQTGYLLGMVVLGVGSVPFLLALRRGRWLPRWLVIWGIVGYAALALGAGIELVSGRPVAVAFAVVGGLFEIVLGAFLVWKGFDNADAR